MAISVTVPLFGARIGFIVFIASTIKSVSPSDTLSPTLTKGGLPGSGATYTVPTIGEGTAPGGGPLGAAGLSAAGAGAAAIGAAPDDAVTIVPPTCLATRNRKPPCSISISVRPVSANRSASSRMAAESMVGVALDLPPVAMRSPMDLTPFMLMGRHL